MEPHFPILLAEGGDKDVFFTKRAFRQAGLQNPLRVVRDGEQAIAYLRGDGKYSDRERYPLPKLLIMGFNIPRLTGLEVLEWIRTNDKFKDLPIVMLSASSLCPDMDLRKARRLGITAHLTRTPDFKELQHVYKIALDQWNLLNMCSHPDAQRIEMQNWPRSRKLHMQAKPRSRCSEMMRAAA